MEINSNFLFSKIALKPCGDDVLAFDILFYVCLQGFSRLAL